MAARDRKNGRGGNVIIKREEIVEGGHHGGAWKVAYADFVTAMMAFFLLMWLLNATTEAQRKGLADYFTPMNQLSRNSSGTGKPFGGSTPFDQGLQASDKGAQPVMPGRAPPPPDEDPDGNQTAQVDASDTPASGQTDGSARTGEQATAVGNSATRVDQTGEKAPGGGVAAAQAQSPSKAEYLAHAGGGTAAKGDARTLADAALRAELERREKAAFQQAADQIRDAVRNDPELADLARQLAIDMTPEGLRIQLLDEEHQPMFPSGSADVNDRARLLLRKIAPVLARLPQKLSITGHTDASPYRGADRTNWELSAERANATRRLLVEAGLPEDRFNQVAGRADRDPLLPADPLAAANRRIAIVVQRSQRSP
jgi:chemotaxis protein MotB